MSINGWARQKNEAGVEAVCVSTQGLNDALPCTLAAKDIESWGFKPHARVRAGLWWKADDVPQILKAVETRIEELRLGLL